MACREEMEENFERATTIAVFHGHVRRAVISRKDGANLANQQGNTAKSKTFNIVTTLILDFLIRYYTEHDFIGHGWLFSK